MAATTKGRSASGKARGNSKSSASRPKRGGTTSGSRQAPKSRAQRSFLASRRPALRAAWVPPRLESHEIDILALALIAIGIFLGGVAYAGWSGGALGNGAVTALRWVFGVLGYAVPAALAVGGALILLRELRPPGRPLRAGALCLTLAITLALAAGTFGIGPGVGGSNHAHAFWRAATIEARGGIVGQASYWICSHLISRLGADILAVFLAVAGVILVSGAGLAGIVRATGAGVVGTGRAIRRSTDDLSAVLGRRSATPADSAGADTGPDADAGLGPVDGPPPFGDDPFAIHPAFGQPPAPLLPPEPETAELVIRPGDGAAALPGEADGGGAEQAAEDGPLVAADEVGAASEADEAHERSGPGREVDPSELTPQGRYRTSVTDDPEFRWRVPDPSFLTRSSGDAARPDTAGQEQTARALIETLGHFGIQAQVVGRVTGPHITRYEIRLAPGTKVAKVSQLKDDLAYALAATDIRILAPIPGKQAVGVEVPNARRRIVHLGDVYATPPPDWSPLTVWLGKDISGKAVPADLAKMPHLLVAGTTGAGKSACVNAMLSSVLLRATPHEVRVVLVDPKQVELNHYESIPHLLTPVITSPRKAANALQNLVGEMERRYSMMSLARTRSLPELNRHRARRSEPPLPYILCVIDELADLMMVAPADVEDSIIRLAQKARAVGMHLVLATQSPRVDVITGMIKANVPSRIAFAVSSQTDSRVILDQNGAESLLGQGDMLFSPVGSSRLQRIQGAFIDEEQILELTESWRRQGEPELHEELLDEVESQDADGGSGGDGDSLDADEDPLLEDAIALVAQMQTASTSMLQRRLRLGYTRAGRLIDMLERRGIISGYEGSKPRTVLIGEADVPRILSHLAEAGGGPAPEVPPPIEPEAPGPADSPANDGAPGPDSELPG
ncbi:MAG TPA: DNA translocase FtsK [Solirubrobacteraceae bacterium]|nr:DNA translocase FtsK [Solirubrobacteraceae bacterium]